MLKTQRSPLGKVSVLYVEDDDVIREQLAQFLRRRVARLLLAENGAEGLALFEREQPDIVVTDVLMPVMDGLKMAERIKAKRPATPVIITSAFKESDYLLKALELALDRYVLKPVNIRVFSDAIESCAKHLLTERALQLAGAVFASAMEAIAVFDSDGVLLACNPAGLRLLGGPGDGASFSALFGAGAGELWQRAVASGSARWELQMTQDGEVLDIDAVLNMITVDEQAPRGVVLLSDVSEQKRAEKQLLQMNQELEQRVGERTTDLRLALEGAEQASRAKSAFLASMSHELRTPLNGILGIAQALQEGVFNPLDEDQKGAVQNLRESGDHLLSLVSDVLDLSKVEANQMRLELLVCQVREVCDACVDLTRGVLRRKGQSLVVHIESPGMALKADPVRLKQILLNLLSNASKFSPAGSQVRLDVSRHEGNIVFVVQDEGIGIDEADLSKLFLPFSQIGGASRATGTGLGLSLVKRMTELHGGHVTVKSKPGQGSSFLVTLPSQVNPSTPPPAPSTVIRPTSLDGMDVLVAEDNHVNVLVLRRFLLSLGCKVRVAGDGRQALEMARESRPEVVLMDMQMPVMDGLQATAAFREDEALRGVPIVAITANAMPGDREECLAAGADDYMSKPVDLRLLAAKLADLRLVAALD